MEERIKVISEIKKSNFFIVGVGGAIAITAGVFIIVKNIDDYVGIIMGLIFLLFGVYAIRNGLKLDIIEVTSSDLILKSIFGSIKKIISREDILSYNEIEKENAKFKHEAGHMKWKELTLFLKNDNKYKIYSTSYNNYKQLRSHLTAGKKRNIKSEKEWKRKNSFYFGLFTSVFGLLGFAFVFANEDHNKTEDNVIGFFFFGLFLVFGLYLIKNNKKSSY